MVLLTAWYQEPLWWYKYGCHFYIQFFVSAVFPSSDLSDLANTVHSLFCILFLPTSSEQSVDSHAAIVVRGLLRHILQLVSSWASYCSHSLLHWHLSKVTCSLLFLWVCDERLVFFRCIALTIPTKCMQYIIIRHKCISVEFDVVFGFCGCFVAHQYTSNVCWSRCTGVLIYAHTVICSFFYSIMTYALRIVTFILGHCDF